MVFILIVMSHTDNEQLTGGQPVPSDDEEVAADFAIARRATKGRKRYIPPEYREESLPMDSDSDDADGYADHFGDVPDVVKYLKHWSFDDEQIVKYLRALATGVYATQVAPRKRRK